MPRDGAHQHRGRNRQQPLDDLRAHTRLRGRVGRQAAADVFAPEEMAEDAVAIRNRRGIANERRIVEIALMLSRRQRLRQPRETVGTLHVVLKPGGKRRHHGRECGGRLSVAEAELRSEAAHGRTVLRVDNGVEDVHVARSFSRTSNFSL